MFFPLFLKTTHKSQEHPKKKHKEMREANKTRPKEGTISRARCFSNLMHKNYKTPINIDKEEKINITKDSQQLKSPIKTNRQSNSIQASQSTPICIIQPIR